MNTIALPVNRSATVPRCGSFENVIITACSGLCSIGRKLRKSVLPNRVVRTESCTLDASTIARSQGSSKCGLLVPLAMPEEGSVGGGNGRSLIATVVSIGAAAFAAAGPGGDAWFCARATELPIGAARLTTWGSDGGA